MIWLLEQRRQMLWIAHRERSGDAGLVQVRTTSLAGEFKQVKYPAPCEPFLAINVGLLAPIFSETYAPLPPGVASDSCVGGSDGVGA